MPELFATFDIPDELEDLEEAGPIYGQEWKFDFERGDFELVAGRPVLLGPYESWVQWCIKAVKTDRFIHLAYSDEYGSEITDAVGIASRSDAETFLENTIIDTLEADERTGSVSDFEFEWYGDRLGVTFTVEPTIGTPERVHITYAGYF